ncbi:MAG: tetratricopeptide repeat protein [Bacteroidia bacterium]|nr:tetratricopeptide repeat protein [Bacteroidia bacterium]
MKTRIICIVLAFIYSFTFAQQGGGFQEVLRLENEGKHKKALDAIEKLIEEEPNRAFYYTQKALIQGNMGKVDIAFETLEEATDMFPDSLIIYDMHGGIYASMNLFDHAQNIYQKGYVRARDPKKKADYLIMIGGLLNGKRSFKEAKKALERAILLDSTNLNAYNNLAHCLKEMGNEEEAMKQLIRVIEVDPDYIPGYINIGYVLHEEGHYQEALDYLDKAIERDSSFAYAFSNRSFCKLMLGDLEGAMQDIDHSLEMDIANSYGYKIRAKIYLAMGKKKNACKDLEEAISWGYTRQYGNEVRMLQGEYCEKKDKRK